MPFFNTPTSERRRQRPTQGTAVMADLIGSRYGGQPAATIWSGQKYEQVLHFKWWIFVAINAIANKIASMTPNVGRIIDSESTSHKFLKHYSPKRMKALTPLRDSEDIEPLERDHALVELLNKPNQYDTPYSVWYQTIMFLRLTGNAYWWTPPSEGFDMPCEIHVIPAHWMIPRCYNPQDGKIVDYYDCRPIAGGGYAAMHFPAEEIVHFKYDSPLTKLDGHAPTAAGDRWFDIAESVDQSRWNAMKQSLNASGVIELSSDYYDPDQAELNRIQMRFLANAGERKSGKPIILSPGMKFTPLMISARELDHGQSADQIRDMALAIFGVTKGVCGIGSGDMSRANLEGLLVGFFANTINPETKRLGETATVELAHQFDKDAVIWWDDGSPSDAAQLNADLVVDISAKTLRKGEYRQRRGLPLFGDARDDEICGDLSPMPGTAGMPNMDDLFSDNAETEDSSGQPQHASDRMSEPPEDGDGAPGATRLPDRLFQTNGTH